MFPALSHQLLARISAVESGPRNVARKRPGNSGDAGPDPSTSTVDAEHHEDEQRRLRTVQSSELRTKKATEKRREQQRVHQEPLSLVLLPFRA